MGYKGRIISVFICLLIGVVTIIVDFHIHGYIPDLAFLQRLILFIPFWWVGKQFDKVTFNKNNATQKIDALQQHANSDKEISQELEHIFANEHVMLRSNDLKNHTQMVSKGSEHFSGHSMSEFEEDLECWLDSLHPDDQEEYKEFSEKIFAGWPANFEGRLLCDNGEIKWFEAREYSIQSSNGEVEKILGVVFNITSRKDEQFNFFVYYDSLTKLPNKELLIHTLEKKVLKAGNRFSLLFIDLDGFKKINDQLGYLYGDKLLIKVATLLRAAFESENVFRFSGDEFIIIVNDSSQLHLILSDLLGSFSEPFILDDKEVYITPSIGVSLYPDHGNNSEDLIKHADAAMQYAKEKGKNTWKYYSYSLEEKNKYYYSMEHDLRKAISHAYNDFSMLYQPQVDIKTGELAGLEALIRWHHPQRGMISPAEFIPVAEKTGLILPLGEWILKEVCNQIITWKTADDTSLPKIAVNVSVIQWQSSDFIDRVKRIINETGVSPEYLEFEITEGFMEDRTNVSNKLNELRKIGIQVAIDDFGTGYSSLSHLKQFPINVLKIDKSFILQNETAIIESICDIAEHLKINVMAEGIETQGQLAFLQSINCTYGQGFYFERPIKAGEFEEKYLRRQPEIIQ
ncbi:EAL domain-containing protein [Salipaludibacillus sp. CUR1]|uniref:bifunctional diguanylate cyclase/phosphodiesterase n=1 Tax=Salipaludibacillus sp. CUR1 TaxID=2820003 RepID=UPI001E2C3EA7|nr:GGDEF domain-containing phosphodiesterase [Salipaludibacillus sp. CUR1]MCE7792731.1 EAL domain-containing protein [Salipaludibacillus sp. CUR1]